MDYNNLSNLYPLFFILHALVCLSCFVLRPEIDLYYVCVLCHYLLGKGGYVFGRVGLSIYLSVCGQHYSKSYERIGMKYYGGALGSTITNILNFGGDLGILR